MGKEGIQSLLQTTDGAAAVPPATCSLYIDQVEYEGLPCLGVLLLEDMDCKKTVQEMQVSIVNSADALKAGLGEKIQSSPKFERLAGDLDSALTAASSQRQIFISSPGFIFRK